MSWRTVFEIGKKRQRIKELEKEMEDPDFWRDREKAAKLTRELSELRQEIAEFEAIKTEVDLKKLELRVFLSGPYDKGNAIFQIFSGTGGQDAQDWARILLRMYQRFCQGKNFQTKILNQSFGQGVWKGEIGLKEVTMEIIGDYAYGTLKRESGVHRLVRISPFSAKGLRHTSFALVEVLPFIPKIEKESLEIDPEDLKIETFRASGPGGQYVQRRETAVRICHLPTKIVVSCQSERLQNQNRQKAMEILLAKLFQLKKREREREIKKIKGEKKSIGWGNQIRSYVFHPYQLVKDLRTGVEASNLKEILDGQIDQFIEAEIKMRV